MKKSQSALEFLMTYGWAFILVLIMIAALVSFGITNPSKLLPSRCLFGTEIACIDHQVSATDSLIRLRLKNNLGESINVTNIAFSTDSASPITCPAISLPEDWPSGQTLDFSWLGCTSFGSMAQGNRGKFSATITYHTVASGANYSKVVEGEISTVVI